MKRTSYIGEISSNDIDKSVNLDGWVHKKRNLGGIIFIDLRDRTGFVQVVFDDKTPPEIFEKADSVNSEFVISISGTIKKREQVNETIKNGDLEIFATNIVVHSSSKTPPIYVKDGDDVKEDLRLKYRYLDLRKPEMMNKIVMRHKLLQETRNFFSSQNFIEVDTPVLIKPTPEGARDYIVPSRVNEGKFYALPQSPQMFKQVLMVSSVDRYFQIAKCFRDEDLRKDRQPEFTQIDLEMSFVDEDDIIEMQEKYIKYIFEKLLNKQVETPFKRLSYKECMDRFGIDRPDLRYGFELSEITNIVKDSQFKVFSDSAKDGGVIKGINFSDLSGAYSRKKIDKLTDDIKTFGAKGLLWYKKEGDEVNSSFAKFVSDKEISEIETKFDFKSGDLILIVCGDESVVNQSLAYLREKIAVDNNVFDKDEFNFLWVVDFPMFEKDEEGTVKAIHHPFTSPEFDDIKDISQKPFELLSRSYDIVLNGVEIGGGSIRIHNIDVQKEVFKTLGLSEEETKEKFGFLLEAFEYGAPPHGGLAYGFDRLLTLMIKEESIREVIAFPKNQAAICPLSDAPSEISKETLSELKILKGE